MKNNIQELMTLSKINPSLLYRICQKSGVRLASYAPSELYPLIQSLNYSLPAIETTLQRNQPSIALHWINSDSHTLYNLAHSHPLEFTIYALSRIIYAKLDTPLHTKTQDLHASLTYLTTQNLSLATLIDFNQSLVIILALSNPLYYSYSFPSLLSLLQRHPIDQLQDMIELDTISLISRHCANSYITHDDIFSIHTKMKGHVDLLRFYPKPPPAPTNAIQLNHIQEAIRKKNLLKQAIRKRELAKIQTWQASNMGGLEIQAFRETDERKKRQLKDVLDYDNLYNSVSQNAPITPITPPTQSKPTISNFLSTLLNKGKQS